MASVSFIAGGVLVAAGAVLYITAPLRKDAQLALSVRPLLAPGVAAIATRGEF